jgi:hypothetical protein
VRIVLPPPPTRKLTPAEAAAVAKRGRKLLRRGAITHRTLVLLDCLLWSCRNPATGAIVVSYTKLASLAHQARETVAGGLRSLEALRVLSRIKRRVRATWANGGVSSRQATSAYVLHPPAANTEFGPATVPTGLEFSFSVQPTGKTLAAQAELAQRAARRQAARDAAWTAAGPGGKRNAAMAAVG